MFQCFRRPTIQVMYWLVEISNIAIKNWWGRAGVGKFSMKFYIERLHPKVQPLTLLYTIFDLKGSHFVYLQLTNGTPFTYLV